MVKELKTNQRVKIRQTSKKSAKVAKQIEFLQELSSADPETTSSMALQSLHLFLKNNKISNIDRFQKKTQQILRFCKICDKFDRLGSMKTCQTCEDNYHKSCYKQPMKFVNGKFNCNHCLFGERPTQKCKVCDKYMAQNGRKTTCQYCHNQYHINCMSLDQNLCKRCRRIRMEMDIDKKSKKIKKEQKNKKDIKETNRNLRDMFQTMKQKKKSILNFSELLIERKNCQFKALRILDGQQNKIKKYKSKLIKVIQSRNMSYKEDLKDIEFHLQKMQEGSMNFGLQNMSYQQQIEYTRYKQQPIGPFIFQQSKQKGYGVIADMDIPRKSIICQYVGQIMTLSQCKFLKINDSVMELWTGRNSDEKLMIRPQKWTNIARFINGVRDSGCNPNLSSFRLCYRGLPCVLLTANRDIKKGESLCYDYNAGGIAAKFDTSHFVE